MAHWSDRSHPSPHSGETDDGIPCDVADAMKYLAENWSPGMVPTDDVRSAAHTLVRYRYQHLLPDGLRAYVICR